MSGVGTLTGSPPTPTIDASATLPTNPVTTRASVALAGTDDTLNGGGALVSIALNDTPPVGNADSCLGHAMQPGGSPAISATTNLLANDGGAEGDALTVSQGSEHAANGVLTLNADGSYSFMPTAGFLATVSSGYVVPDGMLPSADTLNVNRTPGANADAYSIGRDRTSAVANPAQGVLGNDGFNPGNPVIVALDKDPTHSNLKRNPDGSFSVTRHADFQGSDSFTQKTVDDSLVGTDGDLSLGVPETAPVSGSDPDHAAGGSRRDPGGSWQGGRIRP